MSTAYHNLETRFARIGRLAEVDGILGWDSAVVMPGGSSAARGEQAAALAATIHDLVCDERLGDLADEAAGDNTLDAWQRANVIEIRRHIAHAKALPGDLVEALAKVTNDAELLWRSARPANDFKGLLPALRQVLSLVRASGAAKAAALGVPIYDALLNQYEPGGRAADIDRWFAEVAGFLPGLIDAVVERQSREPPPLELTGPFPIAEQKALGERLMAQLGFDFQRGRLDVSLHPFCGGTPEDIRITTRYNEDDFSRALMGVLHETGHALYEMGLPKAWAVQPVGKARGMALHESQSLIVEMQLCRSRAFFSYLAPLLRAAFGRGGPAYEPDNLYRLATRVKRSLIRVDADEVTYPAHVILRYRLERAMIEGTLDLADLPGAWRDGMIELVGIAPSDDRDGCLQDIHWPSGAWGYFPTYTLGAMIAAQFAAAALAEVPDGEARIAAGDFSPITGWTRQHVHGRASSASAAEIVTAATGQPLDPQIFRRHLERRYLG